MKLRAFSRRDWMRLGMAGVGGTFAARWLTACAPEFGAELTLVQVVNTGEVTVVRSTFDVQNNLNESVVKHVRGELFDSDHQLLGIAASDLRVDPGRICICYEISIPNLAIADPARMYSLRADFASTVANRTLSLVPMGALGGCNTSCFR